jgi:hypothetical protein
MNSTEIFSLALGLDSPWKIERVNMKISENSIKELHLHIGHTKRYQFKDKDEKPCIVYDTKDREWRL